MLDPILQLQNEEASSTVAAPTSDASDSSVCRWCPPVAQSRDFSPFAASQPPRLLAFVAVVPHPTPPSAPVDPRPPAASSSSPTVAAPPQSSPAREFAARSARGEQRGQLDSLVLPPPSVSVPASTLSAASSSRQIKLPRARREMEGRRRVKMERPAADPEHAPPTLPRLEVCCRRRKGRCRRGGAPPRPRLCHHYRLCPHLCVLVNTASPSIRWRWGSMVRGGVGATMTTGLLLLLFLSGLGCRI
jgi:hypothetical protein